MGIKESVELLACLIDAVCDGRTFVFHLLLLVSSWILLFGDRSQRTGFALQTTVGSYILVTFTILSS